MLCLTRDEFRRSMGFPALPLDENLYPFFDGGEADCFGFDSPSSGLALPALARSLSLLEAGQETCFGGAFMWFELWDIGSPQLDRIGWSVLEKMRLSYGEMRPLEVAPVHRFRADESTQLQGFLLQAFIFQWDANLVYSRFDRLVHVSHDGYVVVAAATKVTLDECRLQMTALGPKALPDRVRTRFCRPGVATVS